MDKLDAEIGLKQELQDLKDEREQLMIDMEQEAEPEGGEIADRYGSRLNDIDAKMAEIKSELDDLRMYESVNKDEIDEELFTPNEMGDEAVEKESDSAAYESLQESLRKKLRERLK
jgi:phage host-nuclease inhibitor protein Gam